MRRAMAVCLVSEDSVVLTISHRDEFRVAKINLDYLETPMPLPLERGHGHYQRPERRNRSHPQHQLQDMLRRIIEVQACQCCPKSSNRSSSGNSGYNSSALPSEGYPLLSQVIPATWSRSRENTRQTPHRHQRNRDSFIVSIVPNELLSQDQFRKESKYAFREFVRWPWNPRRSPDKQDNYQTLVNRPI